MLTGALVKVSWGDFVSVKTLWISSPSHEDLQVCLSGVQGLLTGVFLTLWLLY